ncbi:MAG: transposase [Methanobrevibacter sp.]|nr:transposase [Candidatus Methanovirga australis]
MDEKYTSQTYNHCGYRNTNLKLNNPGWICLNCNRELDRDVNAAKNICAVGSTGVYFSTVHIVKQSF